MGRKTKHLTKADEDFIKENSDYLTVSEIAKKRKIPYSHIYNYMSRNGIPMLSERSKRKKCSDKKTKGGKYFNPDKKGLIF